MAPGRLRHSTVRPKVDGSSSEWAIVQKCPRVFWDGAQHPSALRNGASSATAPMVPYRYSSYRCAGRSITLHRTPARISAHVIPLCRHAPPLSAALLVAPWRVWPASASLAYGSAASATAAPSTGAPCPPIYGRFTGNLRRITDDLRTIYGQFTTDYGRFTDD